MKTRFRFVLLCAALVVVLYPASLVAVGPRGVAAGLGGPIVTSLTSTATTISAFSPVTFTATVTNAGSPVTTGVVMFGKPGLALGTVALNGAGQASLTTTALEAGKYPVDTTYVDLPNSFAPQSFAVVSMTVNPANTATTVTSSANPSVVGDSVTFTAFVSNVSSPVAVNTGVVFFSLDGNPLGLWPVDSSGTASYTVTGLTQGAHELEASYSGSDDLQLSNGSVTQQVGIAPGLDATAPVVPTVSTTVRESGHVGSASISVSWLASDDVSAADELVFQLQRRRLLPHGWTQWQDVAIVMGHTSLQQVPLWHRYQYRVRARDTAGNWSAYTKSSPATFIRRDERHFTRDQTWTTLAVPGAMRGSVARSSTPDGLASLAFTGNGVALVATSGTGHGKLLACIDPGTTTETCRTIDLAVPPAGMKQLPVVFSLPWGAHTVSVTVVSGSVDLDGAIVSR